MEENWIKFLGSRVFWKKKGEGFPLILLHGLGGASFSWFANVEELAQHFLVILPDLPGFGRSEVPPHLSLDFGKKFLFHFVHSLGIDQFYLLGQSLGGYLALDFALNFPQKVKKLVLVSFPGMGREIGLFLRIFSLPLIGEALSFLLKNQVKLGLKEICFRPELIPEEIIREIENLRKNPKLRKFQLKALRLAVNLFGQKKEIFLRDKIQDLKVRTLIIWGIEDKILPFSHGFLAFHNLTQNSLLCLFSSCGHWPQAEQPDLFNREVIKFLKAKDSF